MEYQRLRNVPQNVWRSGRVRFSSEALLEHYWIFRPENVRQIAYGKTNREREREERVKREGRDMQIDTLTTCRNMTCLEVVILLFSVKRFSVKWKKGTGIE